MHRWMDLIRESNKAGYGKKRPSQEKEIKGEKTKAEPVVSLALSPCLSVCLFLAILQETTHGTLLMIREKKEIKC
jgi:hypothetical protein